MSLSVRLAGIVASGLLLAPGLAAQRTSAEPLRTWAISGARVVPVSGPAMERATVVIRGGIIAAVGTNVAIPSDAQVIDGAGLTVYPGFIDGYSSLGMPSGGGQGGGPGGGGGAAAAAAAQAAAQRPNLAPNSTYGVGLQPEIAAASALTVEFNTFDQARAAGLTAALTAPSGGVFRGQSAMVALGTGAPAGLVIASPVAQHLGFSRGGGGGYPGSLLGVMAQLRQQLLDAQHYGALTAAYARNPRGLARPAHDPSLEALQPVIRGEQPVIFFANSEREILRALDFGKEFGLRLMIAGGNEAWKVADRLRADNVPVLLSANFPRRAAQGGGGAGGGGGGGGFGGGGAAGQPEALSLLTARVEQPSGPKRLSDAGVRFALHPGGNYNDFVANLRRAVAAGLPADRALRAVTLGPAELLGVADRMGTIETGKIANLTIATGDIFDNGTRISRIFVDGVPFEFAAPAQGNRGPAAEASTSTSRNP